jgi:hypothetical protein
MPNGVPEMTYAIPTKSIFRVDIDYDKIDNFEDLEKILHDLSTDLHVGPHDIYNGKGELVGKYGTVRLLR